MDVDRVEAVVGLKKPWSSHTEEHLIGQLSVQFLQPYSQHYPKVSLFGHAWASEVLCQDTQARTTSIPDKPPRSALKETASLSSNNALSAFFLSSLGNIQSKDRLRRQTSGKKAFSEGLLAYACSIHHAKIIFKKAGGPGRPSWPLSLCSQTI